MVVDHLECLLLKYFGFCGLWVSEIHHLVQQFINDDKIISNRFLLQLFEIFSEDLDDFMEEEKDFRCVRVAFR